MDNWEDINEEVYQLMECFADYGASIDRDFKKAVENDFEEAHFTESDLNNLSYLLDEFEILYNKIPNFKSLVQERLF